MNWCECVYVLCFAIEQNTKKKKKEGESMYEVGLWLAEGLTGEPGLVTELFFDAEQLVVLGESFRTAWSSGLDLSRAQSHHQVCDERVFCLSTVVHTPIEISFNRLHALRVMSEEKKREYLRWLTMTPHPAL